MKPTKEVLSFTVILLAVHGDVNAINEILKHFEHYTIRLSQKTLGSVAKFENQTRPL